MHVHVHIHLPLSHFRVMDVRVSVPSRVQVLRVIGGRERDGVRHVHYTRFRARRDLRAAVRHWHIRLLVIVFVVVPPRAQGVHSGVPSARVECDPRCRRSHRNNIGFLSQHGHGWARRRTGGSGGGGGRGGGRAPEGPQPCRRGIHFRQTAACPSDLLLMRPLLPATAHDEQRQAQQHTPSNDWDNDLEQQQLRLRGPRGRRWGCAVICTRRCRCEGGRRRH
ncbi:unnamed protein product [Mycena citricolor]|uniref:Uncharacterized protein n=1 Tax=Mycena citricolor TaxID=2018698 RepID=A0AAD2Q739_9AGAR|nr:unnamed protein product [Mycena citricolor]